MHFSWHRDIFAPIAVRALQPLRIPHQLVLPDLGFCEAPPALKRRKYIVVIAPREI
jgi:hypothetical protein